MYRTPNYKFLDLKILLTYIVIMIIGLCSIYSVEYNPHTSFSFHSEFGKQILFSLGSIFIGVFILLLDGKFLIKLSYLIYILSIILLCAVLIFGQEKFGAKSWFSFGGLGFQPSEFAKFGTALALCKYLSTYEVSLQKKNNLLKIIFFIFTPVFLILLQPDVGSSLVFCFLVIPLFREGLTKWVPISLISSIFLFIITIKYGLIKSIIVIFIFLIFSFFLKKISFKKCILILISCLIVGFGYQYSFENILKKHHQDRINVLFGEEVGAAENYNLNQSLIGIGSGGFFGKGFLKGTQTKGDFIPVQSSDFIFCAIAEEFGFFGSSITVLLFVFFMIRVIIISERQRSKYSRIFGYSFLAIFFSHFSINIGMTIGLFPVIGIPLPFASYGGSSLITMTVFLFYLLKLDSYRMEILK